MTEQLHKIEGAIGYIEYGFASQTGLPMASLENKAGKYIKPTLQSGTAALANVKEMPEDLRVWLPDPEGDDSYSIVTYTWLLCYQKYSDPAKAEPVRTFVKYCSTEGQKVGGEMGYIALPQNVVEKVTQAVDGASELRDPESTPLSSGPSRLDVVLDRGFRGLSHGFAWLTVLLMACILFKVGGAALPAMKQYGIGFITSATWDANKGQFGILPEIWGTLYSSAIALLVGGFFGISIAIFLTQDFLPPKLEVVFKNIIELLAAIPSVVYGMWGMVVVSPLLKAPAGWLHDKLGWVPFFGTSFNGSSAMLPAALVLSIMVLPTITAVLTRTTAALGGGKKK